MQKSKKNKKGLIAVLFIVILCAAFVLLYVKFTKKTTPSAEPSQSEQSVEPQEEKAVEESSKVDANSLEETAGNNESSEQEDSKEMEESSESSPDSEKEQPPVPEILEDSGEIEIIISDELETDGF